MDFEQLLSAFQSKTCVMSVEAFPDGHYGNIRIVAGNQAHCDDMLQTMHRPFIPGSPYEAYFPQNKNFEDFCCRCAMQGQALHSYVRLPQMDLWLNMILLPLRSDRENVGYCVYSYDVTPFADAEQRTSLSADTSSAVLQTCIKLRDSGDSKTKFQTVIEDIREICDSDDCGILLVDRQANTCELLGDSLRPGCELIPFNRGRYGSTRALTRAWDDTIGDSTCLIIKDAADMDWLKAENPLWHSELTEAGAESIVLFPLNYNDETLGYMWAINFNIENTVKIKETLELATFFIASEISNYLLLRRLEMLSSTDMLTGLKNRNSMNAVIGDVESGKLRLKAPCAMVFADLNGLKRVNDEEGHTAGDMLLKNAASVLRSAFPEADVFRAGGDEFLILAPGMDAEELETRIKRLEQAEQAENLHFAVGTAILSEEDDIRMAMHLADERMYIDKSEYYARHPESKYR